MKKKIFCLLCLIFSLVLILNICGCSNKVYTKVNPDGTVLSDEPVTAEYSVKVNVKDAIDTNGINVNFVADNTDKNIYTLSDNSMTSVYISGVNMGLSTSTTNLGNPDISYDTYIEWFNQISQMNANTIRVFTKMPVQFYKAFYDYNNSSSKPLYLIHGIWFNEDFMYDPADCWDSEELVISSFEDAIKEVVDIIHGAGAGVQYRENINGETYPDISQWVIGYILGLEWDNSFVTNSNTHSDKSKFSGKYLKTADNALPFEAFLCRAGETLIEHETSGYNHQTPVAFLNWTTNDILTHDNEPDEYEDSVTVNTENIICTNEYYAGLFAAVDIYPYYPECINYQEEYINYRDELTGKQNNYKAYLKDLKKEYSIPIIVAEFGVPTSRGCASESVLGYNQGNITEEQQGQYVSNMIVDIASSDYAGGLIFSWQDEWFKQTWNTYRYSSATPEKRTPNKMSAEQNYGILAVEAGEKDICYIDADDSDWSKDDLILNMDSCDVSAKYDEAYLYLLVKLKNRKTFDNSKVLLPVSTIGIGSSFVSEYNLTFSSNADFIILIDGKDNSCIKADANYDYFYYKYGVESQYFPLPENFGISNSGTYSMIKQFVTGELFLPVTKKTVAPIVYDTGKLTFGISNPESINYNSLSDFYAKDDTVEIRIPWYLLNVLNITEGVAINNFNEDKELSSVQISDIKIGGAILDDSAPEIEMKPIQFEQKQKSESHTRLKKSYFYIQKTLSMLYG